MNLRFPRSTFLAAMFVAAVSVCAASAQDLKINEQPLRDFSKQVKDQIDNKQVDVTKPFSLEMAAVIRDDGRLDKNASKFTSESGDPKMVQVAKDAIMAMGESGYFGYLQQAGISQATLTVSQTQQIFTGNVHSSQNRFQAALMTSGINTMLSIGRSQKMDANEKLIIDNTRASHDGGNIDINCTLPAADFQRMILGNTAAAGPSH
ncbi:MAG: hypothetical protein ACJ73D_02760 [Pyrinomonadaceae bacterium]